MKKIYVLECIYKNGSIHFSNIAYNEHEKALEIANLLSSEQTMVLIKEIFLK